MTESVVENVDFIVRVNEEISVILSLVRELYVERVGIQINNEITPKKCEC